MQVGFNLTFNVATDEFAYILAPLSLFAINNAENCTLLVQPLVEGST